MAREIRDAEMRKHLGDVANVIIAPGEQRDAILRGLGTVAHAGTAIAMDAPRYIPLLDGRDWDDPPF